ncbi:hypothetical protein KQI36_13690 [Clostridium senegalense]|uniref:hypothetical protein n=1 Tax=Clostridium senegalense TaxID=1465809 RepID=UPI001C10E7B1|nr:hypothetical protein [Clostridium senegalense]MBU5227685.1 hypothetical protein [Clostridium senegalense]
MLCILGGLLFIFIGIVFCLYPSKEEISKLNISKFTENSFPYVKEKTYGKFLIYLGLLLIILGGFLFYFIDNKFVIYIEFVIFILGIISAILFWDKYLKMLIKNLNNNNQK